MKSCWTSKNPIFGLRHFVLINKINNDHQTFFQLVSLVDVEISVNVTEIELINQNKWHSGWLDLSKSESITKDYLASKLTQKNQKKIKKVFLNEDSKFNIS